MGRKVILTCALMGALTTLGVAAVPATAHNTFDFDGITFVIDSGGRVGAIDFKGNTDPQFGATIDVDTLTAVGFIDDDEKGWVDGHPGDLVGRRHEYAVNDTGGGMRLGLVESGDLIQVYDLATLGSSRASPTLGTIATMSRYDGAAFQQDDTGIGLTNSV